MSPRRFGSRPDESTDGGPVRATPSDPRSTAVDDASARIGALIRHLRRDKQLTLVQVAALTGLSHPFLSQVERGQARPSMVSLDRIARALGTSQGRLLAAAESDSPSVGPLVRRADEGVHDSQLYGAARLLAPGARAFEPMEYRSSNQDLGEYFVHDVDEFVHVVHGEIHLDLGADGSHVLGPGDSTYYEAGTRHRWGSTSEHVYHLIVVKQAPAGTLEP